MIKTDWKKCDWDGCNLVAFYRVTYDQNDLLYTMRNICPKHFEESKEMFGNWRIENIK